MTGELCDCFSSKREGVLHILDAVDSAAGRLPVRVWLTDGRLVPVHEARSEPLSAAASNWLALAAFAAELVPDGVLIDAGSTTTDLIPLRDGRPDVSAGLTDVDRLRDGLLVYTGSRRTPVCALPTGVPVAAELFATTLDVGLVLGLISDDPTDTDTADGRPAARRFALARLARMLGGDLETLDESSVVEFARACHGAQVAEVVEALSKVCPGPSGAVVSGSGERLARAAWGEFAGGEGPEPISLTERFGRPASVAACAFALARLAGGAWPDA